VVANLQSVYLLSNVDVTIKTNDATTPASTINLKANKPILWFVDSGYTNPFTADVTQLFVSNAGTVDAVVQLRSLVNATTP
jgi:hypothetical protein